MSELVRQMDVVSALERVTEMAPVMARELGLQWDVGMAQLKVHLLAWRLSVVRVARSVSATDTALVQSLEFGWVR